jgi:hypothetical protein
MSYIFSENNSTVCALERAANNLSRPTATFKMPQDNCEDRCSGVEHFGGRGGGGGGRGGRGGGGRGGGGRGGYRGGGHWGRGYRNWGGGYAGYGYYPYWYGSHYYIPSYYDYPYVSSPPELTEVVQPGTVNGHITFTLALVALVVAFFALRK